MKIFIVIDIGSSSIRCSGYSIIQSNPTKNIINSSSSSSTSSSGKGEDHFLPEFIDGSLVQLSGNALENGIDWITTSCEQVLKDCCEYLSKNDDECEVVGVGISCFVMNLFGVDSNGEVVTPLMSYAGSVEAQEKSKWARLNISNIDEIMRRTGTVFYHPSYALCQLLSLETKVLEKVSQFTTLSSFILSTWLGKEKEYNDDDVKSTISISEGSWTGMLNIREKDWDSKILELLPGNIKTCLPKVAKDQDTAFLVSSHVQKTVHPLLSGKTKFYRGLGDGAAANFGSLCTDSTKIAVTVGTSAAARIVLDDKSVIDKLLKKPDFPPKGLWCYCLDEYRLLLGGALTDGGSIYEWFCNTFKMEDQTEDLALEYLQTTNNNLVCLPFLKGERSMGWHEDASLTLSGIGIHTKPHEILATCMLSLCIQLGKVIECICDLNNDETKILISGSGIMKSKLLQQGLANVLNEPIYTTDFKHKEATSFGVVLFHTNNNNNNLIRIICRPNDDDSIIAVFDNHKQNFEKLYNKIFLN